MEESRFCQPFLRCLSLMFFARTLCDSYLRRPFFVSTLCRSCSPILTPQADTCICNSFFVCSFITSSNGSFLLSVCLRLPLAGGCQFQFSVVALGGCLSTEILTSTVDPFPSTQSILLAQLPLRGISFHTGSPSKYKVLHWLRYEWKRTKRIRQVRLH